MSVCMISGPASPEFRVWTNKRSKKDWRATTGTACGLAFKIKKLSGVTHLKVALKHNLREILAERGSYKNIDVARSCFNVILRNLGTAETTLLHVYHTAKAAGVRVDTIRPDLIWGIEVVFICQPPAGTSLEEFYDDCTRWVESYFGLRVVSSIIHMDQGAPHCHVILFPLKGKKMGGAAIVGYKGAMFDHGDKFYKAFGERLGIERPPRANSSDYKYAALAKNRLYEFLAEKSGMVEEQIATIINDLKSPTAVLKKLGLKLRNVEKVSAVTKTMTRQVYGT